MRRLRIYAQMLFRYRPREFWNELLSESFDLRGVGHFRLSEEENRRMYDAKRAIIDAQLAHYSVEVGAVTRALEIGCGVGYWTAYLAARGVRDYTGNDITPVSVSTLTQRYPQFRFIQGDAGDIILPPATFDLALMIDVTQHITDDVAFARAMRNVWEALAPGGTFVVTFWDPRASASLTTKLRLNRIEKPRPLSAYSALWGASAEVLGTVAFNDKELAVVRKTGHRQAPPGAQ
jgi:SAM-dependent methyltransferase